MQIAVGIRPGSANVGIVAVHKGDHTAVSGGQHLRQVVVTVVAGPAVAGLGEQVDGVPRTGGARAHPPRRANAGDPTKNVGAATDIRPLGVNIEQRGHHLLGPRVRGDLVPRLVHGTDDLRVPLGHQPVHANRRGQVAENIEQPPDTSGDNVIRPRGAVRVVDAGQRPRHGHRRVGRPVPR